MSMRVFKQISFNPLFRIPFNYLDSDVIPLNFHVEGDEIRTQSCSYEHDLFVPQLTRNNRGQ